MDLQAILDASDSDSSGTDNDVIDELPLFEKGIFRSSLVTKKGKVSNKLSPVHQSTDASNSIDLERILMEQDYEDYDEDEYHDSEDDVSNRQDTRFNANPLLRKFDLNQAENDDNISLGASTIPTLSGITPTFANRKALDNNSPVKSNNFTGSPSRGRRGSNNDEMSSPEIGNQVEGMMETSSPTKFLKKSVVYDMPRLGVSNKKYIESVNIHRDHGNRSNESSPSPLKESRYLYNSSCRNPEERALLQSILNDEDEDEDGNGNDASFDMLTISKRGLNGESKDSDADEIEAMRRKIFRAESNASSTVDVDAILYSMDDDSDEDANIAELDEMISRFSLHNFTSSNKVNREKGTPLKKIDIAKRFNGNSVANAGKREQEIKRDVHHQTEKSIEESRSPDDKISNSTKTKKYRHQHNVSSLSASDALTEAALNNAEEYERRLLRPGHQDIVSPLMVKRRMKPKMELETKSRVLQLPKKKSSLLQNNIFNFSNMIESKSMHRIGNELLQNSHYEHDEIGLPTAVSIGSKFIAVGTQRGVILVFDLFEELRQKLGLSTLGGNDAPVAASKQFGSISSIDLSGNGENLVAGYTSGCIAVWDVIKGTIVKHVSDMHPSPITNLRFISEKSLTFISVDAGGLVNKVTFSKPLLWTTYNVESECLLDGTAGQILALSILSPISSLKFIPMNHTNNNKQPYHQSANRIVLIALSSARSSFAIAVEPTVSVLHRWTKPSDEQMNLENFVSMRNEEMNSIEAHEKNDQQFVPDIYLPCLAWNWAIVSGGENSVTPILARGWGCSIQFLRASFPAYQENERADESIHWPAFGDHDEFQSAAPVVAMEWMGNRSLMYLTLTNEMIIVDTVMMTLTERLDFSGIKLVYAEFALSRNTNEKEGDQSLSTTFQNSIRSCEDRVFVLCQEELKTLSIVKIQQRINALEEDGEWLEALALALDHYESTIKSQEDRKRDPDGKGDIINHPEFVSKLRKTSDEEWIADLLIRYLNLAVENAPESAMNLSTAHTKSANRKRTNSKIDLAQSHFQMLAGVCIEFCIVTRRLDLLFNDVYDQFKDSGYTYVFLDVLEPYVLNDKLQYIAPEAMSQFVEHCKISNDVSTVERCLLHMDVTIMDFDSILSLLRQNRMFSALIHVYTHGLDDYISPLEALFESVFDSADSEIISQRRGDGVPHTKFERYGYKVILYLRHCFTNRSFPLGNELRPENRIDTLRPEILHFLKSKKYKTKRVELVDKSIRKSEYPYVKALMMVDAKAFLDTLSLAFDAPGLRFKESIDNQASLDDWHKVVDSSYLMKGSGQDSEDASIIESKPDCECLDRMDFARILSSIVISLESFDATFGNVDQFQVTRNVFYEFMAKYLLRGVFRAPPELTMSVILRLSARCAQGDIIKLLQVLPRNSFDKAAVIKIVEYEGMSRAALVLYKSGVVELFEGTCSSSSGAKYFIKAIESYLKDKEEKFRLEAFDYVKAECIGGSTFRTDGDERTIHDVLRNALCTKLCALVNLDPVLSAQLVAEIFIDELDTILNALERAEEGVVQFKFFHAIISGSLAKIDAVAGPVLLAHLTVDHHQQYLELMTRFHPDMVYQHLIGHDNYRADECLQLCQAHDIADASAYLLEKMGNVSSALQLMLQTLEGRMMSLKRVIRGLSNSSSSFPTHSKNLIRRNHVMKTAKSAYHDTKEAQSVRQILTVALDLCERNSSSTSNSGHGSQLWFNVLDRLINAKGFLRLSKELPEHSEIMLNVLSNLLKMTMERMVSNVALPDLVRKITRDHAGNRLGEFREMISTMLGTYASELEICSSAVNVMNKDVQELMKLRYRLKMRGAKISKIVDKSLPQAQNTSQDRSHIPCGSLLNINTGKAIISVPYNITSRSEKNVNAGKSGLSRMREKRKRMQLKSQANGCRSSYKLSMMTDVDKKFAKGETSVVAFMPRMIGSLSAADHFGRL